MASEGYDFFLNNILDGLGPVEVKSGGSGYFSTPSDDLDPRLFEGDSFRPEVRNWILKTLYEYWKHHFDNAQAWSTVWLAGSGISYQWAADRSNGDLDVLIGVDFPSFYANNQKYVGLSESEVADVFNRSFKDELWPSTAHVDFGTLFGNGKGTGGFEVTFYVNPGSTDIRDINPYAAYNLTDNSWTVRPPVLPEKPGSLYPQGYWDQVHSERTLANGMIDKYNSLSDSLKSVNPGDPGWVNGLHQMGLIIDQARAMFDDIHLGRKQAFAPGGSGYGDFHNFRWQAHKRYGTVQALASIAQAHKGAKEAYETSRYGKPLETASQSLTTAALWNQR